MLNTKNLSLIAILLFLTTGLFGCSAIKTGIEKRDLSVQTKMSDTIFLTPVSAAQKTIFLQIRNTTDQQSIRLSDTLATLLRDKGYTIVTEPDRAHYILQANILQAGKANADSAEDAVESGFGSALLGGAAGAAIGDSSGAAAAGAIAGGAIDFLSRTMVKDVTYTITTDLQISETGSSKVTTSGNQSLRQGSSGKVTQSYTTSTSRKSYQTRVVSIANKVNLTFPEAAPELEIKLAQSIAGIF